MSLGVLLLLPLNGTLCNHSLPGLKVFRVVVESTLPFWNRIFFNPALWVPRPCPHDSLCPDSQSSTRKATNAAPNGGNTVGGLLYPQV